MRRPQDVPTGDYAAVDRWLHDTAERIGDLQRNLDQLREQFIDGVLLVAKLKGTAPVTAPGNDLEPTVLDHYEGLTPVLRLVRSGVSR